MYMRRASCNLGWHIDTNVASQQERQMGVSCLQCGHVLEVDGARGCADSHDRRDDGLIVVVT